MTSAADLTGVRLLPHDPDDQELLRNVHPPDWVNPEPATVYDLVAIGGGTAGLVAAAGAAGLGARVALVERGLMGGDCLNVGCVPSKALLRAARAVADVRSAATFGVVLPAEGSVDFPAVMRRMRRLRARISPNDSAQRFRLLGVDVFLGQARFTGPRTIDVDGRRLRFTRALIATGARPALPPLPGVAEANCLTNENVFALTELPRRLAVVGGGPIGCELAQAFARFGSEVSILEVAPRVLPVDDPAASDIVARALARDGVRLLTGTRVMAVTRGALEKVVRFERNGAQTEELAVDDVLMAVGRAPNVEDLGLDAAGVSHDRKTGVHVDDALRTTNPNVFAAGDVCSRYKFTHLSDAHARLFLRNAFFPGRARASALTLPWCTFTDPEVAHVGLQESDARERGIDVATFTQELAEVDRAILDGETVGFARIHLRRGGDRILGATIVARHAGEMISEVTLAIKEGIGLAAIAATIHPYPTQAEAIRKLGDAYNRTRLTPTRKKLLSGWFAWRRRR